MPWQPLLAQSPTVPFERYSVQSCVHVGAVAPPLLDPLEEPPPDPLELPLEDPPCPEPLDEPLLDEPLEDPLVPPDDPPPPPDEPPAPLDELDELDDEIIDPLEDPFAVLLPDELPLPPPSSEEVVEPRPK